MLSWEFQQFYSNWLRKAERYTTTDLHDLFDKFFTLYVLYNRVYAEATFTLARQNSIKLLNKNGFPDSRAATDYIVQYLGATELVRSIESDPTTNDALERICALIQDEDFHIILDIVSGSARRNDDLALLDSLRSTNAAHKGKAIVRTIYAIRCNTFHGHKQFIGVQSEILIPISTLLRKIIGLVYSKLSTER